MPQPRRGRPRRRVKKNIPYGVAHIKTSFNNTIVTQMSAEFNFANRAWEMSLLTVPTWQWMNELCRAPCIRVAV